MSSKSNDGTPTLPSTNTEVINPPQNSIDIKPSIFTNGHQPQAQFASPHTQRNDTFTGPSPTTNITPIFNTNPPPPFTHQNAVQRQQFASLFSSQLSSSIYTTTPSSSTPHTSILTPLKQHHTTPFALHPTQTAQLPQFAPRFQHGILPLQRPAPDHLISSTFPNTSHFQANTTALLGGSAPPPQPTTTGPTTAPQLPSLPHHCSTSPLLRQPLLSTRGSIIPIIDNENGEDESPISMDDAINEDIDLDLHTFTQTPRVWSNIQPADFPNENPPTLSIVSAASPTSTSRIPPPPVTEIDNASMSGSSTPSLSQNSLPHTLLPINIASHEIPFNSLATHTSSLSTQISILQNNTNNTSSLVAVSAGAIQASPQHAFHRKQTSSRTSSKATQQRNIEDCSMGTNIDTTSGPLFGTAILTDNNPAPLSNDHITTTTMKGPFIKPTTLLQSKKGKTVSPLLSFALSQQSHNHLKTSQFPSTLHSLTDHNTQSTSLPNFHDSSSHSIDHHLRGTNNKSDHKGKSDCDKENQDHITHLNNNISSSVVSHLHHKLQQQQYEQLEQQQTLNDQYNQYQNLQLLYFQQDVIISALKADNLNLNYLLNQYNNNILAIRDEVNRLRDLYTKNRGDSAGIDAPLSAMLLPLYQLITNEAFNTVNIEQYQTCINAECPNETNNLSNLLSTSNSNLPNGTTDNTTPKTNNPVVNLFSYAGPVDDKLLINLGINWSKFFANFNALFFEICVTQLGQFLHSFTQKHQNDENFKELLYKMSHDELYTLLANYIQSAHFFSPNDENTKASKVRRMTFDNIDDKNENSPDDLDTTIILDPTMTNHPDSDDSIIKPQIKLQRPNNHNSPGAELVQLPTVLISHNGSYTSSNLQHQLEYDNTNPNSLTFTAEQVHDYLAMNPIHQLASALLQNPLLIQQLLMLQSDLNSTTLVNYTTNTSTHPMVKLENSQKIHLASQQPYRTLLIEDNHYLYTNMLADHENMYSIATYNYTTSQILEKKMLHKDFNPNNPYNMLSQGTQDPVLLSEDNEYPVTKREFCATQGLQIRAWEKSQQQRLLLLQQKRQREEYQWIMTAQLKQQQHLQMQLQQPHHQKSTAKGGKTRGRRGSMASELFNAPQKILPPKPLPTSSITEANNESNLDKLHHNYTIMELLNNNMHKTTYFGHTVNINNDSLNNTESEANHNINQYPNLSSFDSSVHFRNNHTGHVGGNSSLNLSCHNPTIEPKNPTEVYELDLVPLDFPTGPISSATKVHNPHKQPTTPTNSLTFGHSLQSQNQLLFHVPHHPLTTLSFGGAIVPQQQQPSNNHPQNNNLSRPAIGSFNTSQSLFPHNTFNLAQLLPTNQLLNQQQQQPFYTANTAAAAAATLNAIMSPIFSAMPHGSTGSYNINYQAVGGVQNNSIPALNIAQSSNNTTIFHTSTNNTIPVTTSIANSTTAQVPTHVPPAPITNSNPSTMKVTCTTCNVQVKNKDLANHMNCHKLYMDPAVKFKCDDCKMGFANVSAKNGHYSSRQAHPQWVSSGQQALAAIIAAPPRVTRRQAQQAAQEYDEINECEDDNVDDEYDDFYESSEDTISIIPNSNNNHNNNNNNAHMTDNNDSHMYYIYGHGAFNQHNHNDNRSCDLQNDLAHSGGIIVAKSQQPQKKVITQTIAPITEISNIATATRATTRGSNSQNNQKKSNSSKKSITASHASLPLPLTALTTITTRGSASAAALKSTSTTPTKSRGRPRAVPTPTSTTKSLYSPKIPPTKAKLFHTKSISNGSITDPSGADFKPTSIKSTPVKTKTKTASNDESAISLHGTPNKAPKSTLPPVPPVKPHPNSVNALFPDFESITLTTFPATTNDALNGKLSANGSDIISATNSLILDPADTFYNKSNFEMCRLIDTALIFGSNGQRWCNICNQVIKRDQKKHKDSHQLYYCKGACVGSLDSLLGELNNNAKHGMENRCELSVDQNIDWEPDAHGNKYSYNNLTPADMELIIASYSTVYPRVFACHTCQVAFSSQTGMNLHLSLNPVHKEGSNVVITEVPNESPPNPLVTSTLTPISEPSIAPLLSSIPPQQPHEIVPHNNITEQLPKLFQQLPPPVFSLPPLLQQQVFNDPPLIAPPHDASFINNINNTSIDTHNTSTSLNFSPPPPLPLLVSNPLVLTAPATPISDQQQQQ